MSDYPEKRKHSEDWLSNRNNRVIGGLVLIGLGIVFFLQQAGLFTLSGNWWAFFILIPGLGLLWSAYNIYNRAGTLTRDARQQLVGALFVLTVAGIFIFDLNWGRVWPVFLILAGLGALFGWRD